ncbi:MAG: hypothetical protein SGJ09_08285 [Phycisphaerae bacterium]|mgnify:CR=1 FL=1|nr:hypothetical protein [Phycisphaerae bacterium]
MKKTKSGLIASGIAALCSATLAANASELVAYEGFNYAPTNSLAGLNGGTGWSSHWLLVQEIPTGVGISGLTWPNLQTSGNCAATPPFPNTAYSIYSRNIAPYTTTDGVVYVSFLFRPVPGFGQGGGLEFGSLSNGMIVGAHPGTFHYGLMNTAFSGVDTTVPVEENVTALCVVRINNNFDGTITYGLFVNPMIDDPQPVAPEATYTMTGALPVNIKILNDGGFLTDEIRVGTTWTSVLPSTLTAPCPGDLDASGSVNASDLGILLGGWGGVLGDINGDGTTDAIDLGLLLGAWGACP